MSPESATVIETKRPWHLWLIGIVSLFWYVSGALTFLMAQTGKLTSLGNEEVLYYEAQPIWFVLLTDSSFLFALIATLALLLKRRLAFNLYMISLATILLSNGYEFITGTSRALENAGAMIMTSVVVVIAALLLFYSWSMKRRGVLK